MNMDSEDGELFIKQLATFVRTHEKALANALQLRKQNAPRHGASHSVSSVTPNGLTSPTVPERPATSGASASNGLASALSFGSLNFTSQSAKSAKLALTPHHLFYLLSRFEELAIPVGPMKVRLENLHDTTSSANYVSFLSQTQRSKTGASEVGSIRSVSSMRSVMSGMSALWSNFGIGNNISAARGEKQKAALQADLKYLYSAFTKIPCLRLAPDWRARLIKGYEEFPFDSAVPLYVFKNCQALEVCDIDFRQFFGWDRMADQLRSLTLKRASIENPADLLIDIVLDDMDKRRRRTSKQQRSPTTPWPGNSSPRRSMTFATPAELQKSTSAPGSPGSRPALLNLGSVGSEAAVDDDNAARYARRKSVAVATIEPPRSPTKTSSRPRSHSPRRPASSRHGSQHIRGSHKVQRSGSGSSQSSLSDSWYPARGSMSNFPTTTVLPSSKWRFLRHLSLAENSLTSISAASFMPLANTLYSLDLSNNLFKEIPDSLATLTALRALNLSKCMIESLHSLTRNPLPAITALNLRENRLESLAGIERLYPLERLDLRDNGLKDPVELARLTNIPDIREIWVEGNPFTKTHKDYRITIFNLFRQSPGYTEDILIDTAGPTSSEKRYLVERTKEPLPVPVIRPPVPEIKAVDVSKPTIVYDAPPKSTVLRKERPSPKTVASEVNTSSTRRPRRAPKRRIVDLADTKPLPPRPVLEEEEAPPAIVSPDFNYRISQTPEIHQLSPTPEANRGVATRVIPRIDTSTIPKLPPVVPAQDIGTPTSWAEPDRWDAGGELYRRKIDTLRSNVVDGYLGALSEERWDTGGTTHFTESPFGHSNSSIHPNSAAPTLHRGNTELSSVAI
ncbi:hypothetical protein M406DRAFT_245482 [Cryphonectria parasitica EP155]|uniref:Leucine-rich repeat-containing protein n=1 Tax=Cryphonectria parasitica (strain ATCC 38755 / EP155) TaxID=660469 RepID=A0A9P4YA75_CRYP1|nr:uncharacterized protein M406DRAFT_245482 [Cryphonectria parasitica EP155]KAF3769621.1 hypothetical protein M406DRAFT_245482 [Cryphonectria parasitica EP155]